MKLISFAASVLLTAGIVSLGATPAQAKAVQIEGPKIEVVHRDPVLYVEHVQRHWFYAELADGSSWMVTRCRHEDSNNCWWDAQKRGNGEGRSFFVLHGQYHKAVRGTIVR